MRELPLLWRERREVQARRVRSDRELGAQGVFATASLRPAQLAVIAPFPVIVWGADEIARWVRRRAARPQAAA